MSEKVFRVFLTRSYRTCVWFDVVADSERRAWLTAKKAANKFFPDVREVAVDNGWVPQEPVEIRAPGVRGDKPPIPGELTEVQTGVFTPEDDFQRYGGKKCRSKSKRSR